MTPKPYHHLAICDDCRGTGSTVAYLGDVTDWMQEDPEFAEDYLAGAYDKPCPCCKGSGRVEVLSAGAPFAVRREYVERRRIAEDTHRLDAVQRAEMRACGWEC